MADKQCSVFSVQCFRRRQGYRRRPAGGTMADKMAGMEFGKQFFDRIPYLRFSVEHLRCGFRRRPAGGTMADILQRHMNRIKSDLSVGLKLQLTTLH